MNTNRRLELFSEYLLKFSIEWFWNIKRWSPFFVSEDLIKFLKVCILSLLVFYSGRDHELSPNFAPILCAQANPLKATAFNPCPGKQESPTQ